MAMEYETLNTLAELPAGRDTVKIEVKRNGGRVVVDIRRWYEGDDEELHPSPKGVSLPPALGEDVLAALTLAFDEAAEVVAEDDAAKAAKANGAKKAPAKKAAARKAPAKKAATRKAPAARKRPAPRTRAAAKKS